MADKCWKGTKHEYEREYETSSHIVKQCINCKGRKWVSKRPNALDLTKNKTKEPVRV